MNSVFLHCRLQNVFWKLLQKIMQKVLQYLSYSVLPMTSVNLTTSTGTVHTSAKAHLTSVAMRIRIRIRYPYRHQNLIICSLAHCQPSSKISCKSVGKFLREVANRQANRQTTTITYPRWRR